MKKNDFCQGYSNFMILKKILLGLALIGVYLLAAFFAAGGGHGTYIFFTVAMPYGLGALIYPILFGISGFLQSRFVKTIYVGLVFAHYIVTSIFISIWWQDDIPYLIKTWNINPLIVLIPSVWFMIMQFIVWKNFHNSFAQSNVELQ
jgi:hypothetical protein